MLKDRTKVTTNTTGTGTLTLGSADSGFQDFSSISGQTYYAITNKSIWEVGLGTVSSGTLSRDQVYDSSSSGSRIDLSGKSSVFVTYPASKAVYLNPSSSLASGDLLFKTDKGWNSRPLSSGDVTIALGYSPSYTANSGVRKLNDTFVMGGTGTLQSLEFVNERNNIVSIGTQSARDVKIGKFAGEESLFFDAVAIGTYSLSYSTGMAADNTISIGNFTLSQSFEPLDTTAIGNYAGFQAKSPSYSVFLGTSAGVQCSGQYNIYIGRNAGSSNEGSYNLEIVPHKNYAEVFYDKSYKIHIAKILLGDWNNKKLAIGNVSSTNIDPNATLEILPKVSGDIGLMVKGVASHSANLFEVDNSSGGNLFTVAPNGLASGVKIATSGGLQLNSGIPSSTDSILYSNGSSLFWNGSKIVPNYSIKTASSAITYLSESDNVILLSSGRLGLFFSSTSNSHGKIFYVKSLRDDAMISPISIFNPLPPYDSVTDTIDGSSNDIYTKRYESYALTPTSSGWMILSKYSNVVDGNL